MRSRQIGSLIGILLFGGFTVTLLRQASPSLPSAADIVVNPLAAAGIPHHPHDASSASIHDYPTAVDDQDAPEASDSTVPSIEVDLGDRPAAAAGEPHPIYHLVSTAETAFEELKASQSKSLEQAVRTYRQRYGIPPPPHFDKWYDLARKKGVQLIDEFDSVHDSLMPFWGLKPETIRKRAKEAIGFDNALIAVLIRNGKVVKIEGGDEWQQHATRDMMAEFVQYLPDMDLAFNIHDEPRVVVPFDDLSRLVRTATTETMLAAAANAKPRNEWSPRPSDVNDGRRIEDARITRFNRFAHQPTWTHSRLSCPPESPSRSLEEKKYDDYAAYGYGELAFVSNHTAFSDICNSPSLSETFGFFDRPNAFNIVHDLFPIFSQSKISSFQDILYPSPWYWYGKVKYNVTADMPWEQKEDKMYWRGSTTGGFSRDGGWRRQHRQRFVQKINSNDKAKILENTSPDATKPHWKVKSVPRGAYADKIDVLFSSVGQCDPGDCQAQEQFFNVAPAANFQDAWKYKYLLDIDGNAFSGRFYAFLESWSLVFKMNIFREWHMDWLKPWVHYIPLSLHGEEWLEAVRYFEEDVDVPGQGQRLANQGRDWSKKVLRNEDLELWFFRLLLEYGRVIDDDRESIGFALP